MEYLAVAEKPGKLQEGGLCDYKTGLISIWYHTCIDIQCIVGEEGGGGVIVFTIFGVKSSNFPND